MYPLKLPPNITSSPGRPQQPGQQQRQQQNPQGGPLVNMNQLAAALPGQGVWKPRSSRPYQKLATNKDLTCAMPDANQMAQLFHTGRAKSGVEHV